MRRFLVIICIAVTAMLIRRNLLLANAIPTNPLAYASMTRYGTSPVLARGGVGTWDHDTIAGQQVFRDNRLGQWVMVYTGLDKPLGSGGITGVGLAYSTDLLTWTKEAANPVFVPNSVDGQIATGNIIQLSSSSYRMYYQAYNGTGGGGASMIYAASSSDMLSWSRLNGGVSVLPPSGWAGEFTFDPDPHYVSGTTYLFFAGQKDTAGVKSRGIGLTTSTDGVTFSMPASPLITPAGGESQLDYGAPAVIGDIPGGAYEIFHDSSDSATPSTRYICRDDTTDGSTFTHHHQVLTAYAGSSWGETVQVFDSAPVVWYGTLYLFYAGSATTGGGLGLAPDIGLATMRWP